MTKNSAAMATDWDGFDIHDPIARQLPGIPKVHQKFDLTLINTDSNLGQLTQRMIERGPRKPASFCFFGPPGSGKSEYARYLARHLKAPCHMVHASEILLPKWGETERALEDIFKNAASRNAILVFDEVDSFLYDRRDVKHAWERQVINEFLRHFDEYTGVIICTTNLVDTLDAAVLRRLVFKIGFKEMSREQAARAFENYFAMPAPTYISQELSGLTLGDFAVAHKKADILGMLADGNALCRLLYEEVATRHTMRLKRRGRRNGTEDDTSQS
jgi:SpoVK/Ycf46/Vps4 family AAA+-type ATPase